MGRTYRNEKMWGAKGSLPKKGKVRNYKGTNDKPLNKESNHEYDDYDDLEMEAYEEEYNERLRKKRQDRA